MIALAPILASAATPGWKIDRTAQHTWVDLDGDGRPELIVYEGGGNSIGSWALVDGVTGAVAGWFEGSLLGAQPAASGWPALVTYAHTSAAEGVLTTWERRGAAYDVASQRTVGPSDPGMIALDRLGPPSAPARAVPPALGAPASLCATGATAVLACETAKGKLLSVCAAGRALEYRFGRPGAIELTVAGTAHPFTLNGWTGASSGAPAHALVFGVGTVTYQVYETRPADGRGKTGVRVLDGGKTVADIACTAASGTVRWLDLDWTLDEHAFVP